MCRNAAAIIDIIGWQFNSPGERTWVYVGQVLPVGEWYHIAVSHDGETVKLYLDGEETDSAEMTGFAGSTAPFLIGSEGWGFHWIGGIDDVRLYASVEWCILTNGVIYKVYRSTEKAEAPDKLLFEISLDPKENEGMSIQQVAEQFARLSRDAMARGLLDEIGEQIFTTSKIRKALDKLFLEPPNTLVRLIRSTIRDDTIKPTQVKNALKRLWGQPSAVEDISTTKSVREVPSITTTRPRGKEYTEDHHTKDKPQEVIELFRTIDKFCRELDPANVHKRYRAKTVNYSHGKNIFCSVHLYTSGLRGLKLCCHRQYIDTTVVLLQTRQHNSLSSWYSICPICLSVADKRNPDKHLWERLKWR